MRSTDTIVAVASGQGRAAVSLVRISGPAARDVVARFAGRVPEPRHATLRVLRDPASGEALDEALVLWFPGPRSFTGEDSAEFHVHGGPAVRSAVLGRLASEPGCRLAQAGEFTRRAFLNGRLDLSAVEGLADLIDAETDAQRRQAMRQYGGGLRHAVETWRDGLVDALAWLEAGLDFTDEDDIPDAALSEGARRAAAIRLAVDGELARAEAGERLRDGALVVIAGPPNAGKSTLLNAIVRRDAAIVSPYPGTTRDAIEVRCEIAGWPVTLVDTAGLRDASDPVERIGIGTTRRRVADADVLVWLRPAGTGPSVDEREAAAAAPHAVVVLSRADEDLEPDPPGLLPVSGRTGLNLDRLLDEIGRLASLALQGAEDTLVTRERHRIALRQVAEALARSERAAEAGHGELAAEDVRLALRALGTLTGTVDLDQVLDRVFGQFCIGK